MVLHIIVNEWMACEWNVLILRIFMHAHVNHIYVCRVSEWVCCRCVCAWVSRMNLRAKKHEPRIHEWLDGLFNSKNPCTAHLRTFRTIQIHKRTHNYILYEWEYHCARFNCKYIFTCKSEQSKHSHSLKWDKRIKKKAYCTTSPWYPSQVNWSLLFIIIT